MSQELDVHQVSVLITDREGLVRQVQITDNMANTIFEFIKAETSGHVMISEPLNGRPVCSVLQKLADPNEIVDPKSLFTNLN